MTQENTQNIKPKRKFRFPLWLKSLIVLVLSISAIGTVAIIISRNQIQEVTRNHYIEHSVELADTFSLFLDSEDVKTVKNAVNDIYTSIDEQEKYDNSHWDEDEWINYVANFEPIYEMDEYKRLMEQIVEFHSVNEAKYTYIGYPDLVGNRLVYLVDDSPEDEQCPVGSFDAFTDNDYSIHTDPDTGFRPEITNMPEYGYLASTGRPIRDSENKIIAYAMVDLSMDAIVAKEETNTIMLTIVLVSISVGAILIGFLLVLFLINRPIRQMTKAANEYVQGDGASLDKFSQLNIRTKDELEDLANSMKKMEGDINHYINDLLSTTTKLKGAELKATEMKNIADRDALTGVFNKRAYYESEERLNEAIKTGTAKFALSMIDLNDLKVINDTLGHEKGDEAIRTLSDNIKVTFRHSNIYRIGGDEFVVISEKEDLTNIDKIEKDFLKRNSEEELANAAIGVVIFDPRSDNNLEDTFKRADKMMYENKKTMKEGQ